MPNVNLFAPQQNQPLMNMNEYMMPDDNMDNLNMNFQHMNMNMPPNQ